MLRIAALFIVVLASALLSRPVQAQGTLLELLENQVVAQRMYGPEHPRLLELQVRIEGRTAAGETVESQQAERRLEALLAERTILKTRWGIDHPALQTNAERISLVAKILADSHRGTKVAKR